MKEKQEELEKYNKDLCRNTQELTKRVAELNQYSRLNSVEIKGVLFTQGEDCATVLHKLMTYEKRAQTARGLERAVLQRIDDKVGCPFHSTDIEVVHRVPAKKETNIIGRFYSREKRPDCVGKGKNARLTTKSIWFSATEENDPLLFINDHLTAENKRLFEKYLP